MRLMRAAVMMSQPKSTAHNITLLGDLMLGRLIDQLLPDHVNEPEDGKLAAYFRRQHSHLEGYDLNSPFTNWTSFFKRTDLVLGNLETAVTTNATKWPDKVFNYRMHPANLQCLVAAGVHYVSLANNHTLDFERQGLRDTLDSISRTNNLAFAGAGYTEHEAKLPAILSLPSKCSTRYFTVHVHSYADHPSDWSPVQEFNHLRYSPSFCETLKSNLSSSILAKPDLKIVSLHWGPNYSWRPSADIISLAHYLVDECEVDVIHGHSSHHVQGVEVYNGKLIVYGCGDFVDDYAVNVEYRNDLSAAWSVILAESEEDILGTRSSSLNLDRLEVWPNRIKHFQATKLNDGDRDHAWVVKKLKELCSDFDTSVDEQLGSGGQMVIPINQQR